MSLVSTWLLGDVLEMGPATGQPRKGSDQGTLFLTVGGLQRWALDGMDDSVALLGLASPSAGQLRQLLRGGLADFTRPGTYLPPTPWEDV